MTKVRSVSSKSLIGDEADFGDCVSGLSSGSFKKTRVHSDGKNEDGTDVGERGVPGSGVEKSGRKFRKKDDEDGSLIKEKSEFGSGKKGREKGRRRQKVPEVQNTRGGEVGELLDGRSEKNDGMFIGDGDFSVRNTSRDDNQERGKKRERIRPEMNQGGDYGTKRKKRERRGSGKMDMVMTDVDVKEDEEGGGEEKKFLDFKKLTEDKDEGEGKGEGEGEEEDEQGEDEGNVTLSAKKTGESDSYLSESRFDQCPISPLSLKGIRDAGFERMTLVQEATLPIILKGKDVLAKARTGTGKTVAFLLPAIELILQSPPVTRDQKRPPIYVLIICPTRELANQAATEANTLLKYHPLIGTQVVIGGTNLASEQKRMQSDPCQILVATPGRLRDHIQNTAGFATRLMGVKILVLDEADHLLAMGFRIEIKKIISAVPKLRQTLLFSATIPQEVRQICHIALKKDHEFINAVQEGSEDTHSKVRQMHLVAPLGEHFSLVYSLLKDHIADDANYKILVFCTTAMVTSLASEVLGKLSLNVREIHSRKTQSYRTQVSDEFRKSKGLILVTSDVSARGVDYPDVTLVIQIGVPADREQYIHRLGRTGRKGKEGEGILLLAPWEEFFLSNLKDLPISKAPEPLVDPDTRKKVERALLNVEMKTKESAYQAWLGYYTCNKNIGRDKYRLVELANEFSRSMGLNNPPAIARRVLGKMGLGNIPGLRSK